MNFLIFTGSTISLAAGLLFGGIAGFGAYRMSNDPKDVWVSLGYSYVSMILNFGL